MNRSRPLVARWLSPEGTPRQARTLTPVQGPAHSVHEGGYAAVGGAIDAKRMREYAAGGGRHPRFPHPLVLRSLLPPLEPNAEVAGLPAYRPEHDEPTMFDGRLVLKLRRR